MPWVYEIHKPEYPPLLPMGLHPMSLSDVRTLCVDQFPLSTRRHEIMSSLEHVVDVLLSAAVKGELWVDGSFLTNKIDPDDSDVVLRVQESFLTNPSPAQQDAYTWFADEFGILEKWLCCHCFPFVEYPVGHPLYWQGYYDHAYWIRQWGFSRSNV